MSQKVTKIPERRDHSRFRNEKILPLCITVEGQFLALEPLYKALGEFAKRDTRAEISTTTA
jgi:hypothetical protein